MAADSIGRIYSQFLKPYHNFSRDLPLPTSQNLSFSSYLLKVNSQFQVIGVQNSIGRSLNLKALSTDKDGFLSLSQVDDDSPVSIQLEPVCSETQFDRVIAEAQQLEESVIVVWMASWCRKCIYLKPKLEKLAANYYPRLRFYCVDVNSVSQKLVTRAGVTKMPTIQLWKDGRKQGEVIGGYKAHFVVDEVREMIESESTG